MGTVKLTTKSLDLGIPSFAKDPAVITDVENRLRQLRYPIVLTAAHEETAMIRTELHGIKLF